MRLHKLVLALLALASGPLAAADGAALFRQHCATCHQDSGAGTVGLAPSLLGEHWQKLGAERSYLPAVLLKGLAGPIKVGAVPFNGSMPAQAGTLDDEALTAIANHLRTLQGAAADKPYAAADFAEARARPGNPAQTRALRRQILGE
ncbi:MAG: cytochrome c [Rubrivivax sp.]|nr:cytochrome c [Rubrivivax sp.]